MVHNLALNVFDDKNLEVKHLVSKVLATNVIGVKELESFWTILRSISGTVLGTILKAICYTILRSIFLGTIFQAAVRQSSSIVIRQS